MVTINQAAAYEPKLEVQTTAAAPTEPGTKGWSVHIFIDTLHNEGKKFCFMRSQRHFLLMSILIVYSKCERFLQI